MASGTDSSVATQEDFNFGCERVEVNDSEFSGGYRRNIMDSSVTISSIVEVGSFLKEHHYHFTAVTPESHRRVLARNCHFNTMKSTDIYRHFFGWNRAVPSALIAPQVLKPLKAANLIVADGPAVKSLVRFATLDDKIFAHSGFPTDDEQSVFFGPDSYRFINFLKQSALNARRVLDVGCGSGVGALAFSAHSGLKGLCDINDRALSYSKANAVLNSCQNVEVFQSDILKNVPEGFDLLIANPPFIMDSRKRQYRHGGNHCGSEMSLKIIDQAMSYLQPGGRLAMYTGSCIVAGEDTFLKLCKELVPRNGFNLSYQEIDPDIFGEELSQASYSHVDRIAAVGLVLEKV
ncbi:class I SAM-dependent methyltransferase [Bdellovibrio sp. SKB1291214]|uniref:methyltransferase n=1 Tax=Bdellovibrio sp. SKB1291214 TaxID=1732569 RepID=UPI000B51E489|nr:class I SAM-dependent methyltransferase [Bdellovibrio sp. SKB1291214]UYL07507.1 class I SAM-dependent methyltransferase [Bdellovibrio sp. SKB1291214]